MLESKNVTVDNCATSSNTNNAICFICTNPWTSASKSVCDVNIETKSFHGRCLDYLTRGNYNINALKNIVPNPLFGPKFNLIGTRNYPCLKCRQLGRYSLQLYCWMAKATAGTHNQTNCRESQNVKTPTPLLLKSASTYFARWTPF